MFIRITTQSNALRTENFLRPYKRGEKEFTPEVARQILTMTNHPKNIRDTLQLIADLPPDRQALYKEIILSAFDHREQPNEFILLGKKLAVANGFNNELNVLINSDYTSDTTDGIIYASATNQIAMYIATGTKPNLYNYPDNISLYCTSDKVNLDSADFSKIKSLKFKEGSEVSLRYCKDVPTELDVSMCHKVDFTAADLTCRKSLKFADNTHIILNYCRDIDFPLDFSNCAQVELKRFDMTHIPSIKFQNKQQQHQSGLEIPADWYGTITYAKDSGFFSSLLHKINTRN